MIEPCGICYTGSWAGERTTDGKALCAECAEMNPELISRPVTSDDLKRGVSKPPIPELVPLPEPEIPEENPEDS